MHKYNNFIEYLNKNYSAIIKQELKSFLLKKNNLMMEDLVCFNDCIIKNIEVLGIKFKKSELDNVAFDCHFKSDYSLVNNFVPSINKIDFNKSFSCYFRGSFSNGFKLSRKEIEIIDEKEFDENLTLSLVPIIPKNKMELYATKFLKYFCVEALKEPKKLDLKKMLNDKGIFYHFAPLEDDVYGKIYFSDDKALIYDNEGKIKKEIIKRGTILINKEKEKERGYGSLRNTIIHEVVHWFYHRNYFELRQLLNPSLTCAVCYKSNVLEKNKDIAWMEKQARSLAPKILMPKKQVLEKYKEFTELIKYEYNEALKLKKITKGYIFEQVVKMVANFFGVSKISAKYRLIELGKIELDGIFNYNKRCNKYYVPYSFNNKTLHDHQTFFISEESLLSLLQKDKKIRDAILLKKILYINGLLVVNNPKYVNNAKSKLTNYAFEHIDECCLIINVSSEVIALSKSRNAFTLCSGASFTKLKAQISQEQLAKILLQVDENSLHYEKNKKNLPIEFGETIEYHCKKSGYSYEGIAASCDINEKTLRKYRNESLQEYDPIVIIKFGLGLNLSYPYIQDLLEKADRRLIKISPSNNLLLSIISTFSRVGMEELYKALKEIGKEKILNLSINYLKNNNLLK